MALTPRARARALLARTNGIPEYTFRRFPRARPWMDEHCPAWPDIARAIADLSAGLDDTEYVGGVIYLGLTHKGAEHAPPEQRRVITDRLVRWATRDGAEEWQSHYQTTSALADAIGGVLAKQLPA